MRGRRAAAQSEDPRAAVVFKTKPELGVELVERAADWKIAKAPVLGDHAYGENTGLRDRLDEAGSRVRAVRRHKTKVFEQGTMFAVPAKKPERASRSAADHGRDRPKPEPIGELIGRLERRARRRSRSATGPTVTPITSQVHASRAFTPPTAGTTIRDEQGGSRTPRFPRARNG